MSEAIAIPGYQVMRQLGQGGTATVYLAIQNSFGREVALKVMSPLLNQDPTFAPRFTREARIVSQMHHASIVPVFDVGEHQRHHYLSMELLPGGDLRQRIVNGSCGQKVAIEVLLAIGSALELAHRKGFVHRDIKPQNILFREDGTPVLTDFGIARAIDVGTSLTAAGMFVGTPNYMSPEQVKGLELDGRSDLYSLGIVFYEMLTGSVPFQADSALSIALKHLSDPLPPLPPQLAMYQPFIDKLTAKDKQRRFANSTEMIRALSTMTDLPAGTVSTLVRQHPNDANKTSRTNRGGAVLHAAAPATVRKWAHKWAPWGVATLTLVAMGAGYRVLRPQREAAVAVVVRPEHDVVTTVPAAPADPTLSTEASLQPPAAPAAATPVAEKVAVAEQVTEQPIASTAAAPAAKPLVTAKLEERPVVSAPAAPVVAPPPIAVESLEARNRRLTAERDAREVDAANRRQEQIAGLIADAQTRMDSGDLVRPPGDSATDRYRAVLQLQPLQPDAIAGLQQVADALVADAEQARKAGEVDQALALLADARSVQPDHPRLAKLQADLQGRQVKLQRRAGANLQAAVEHVTKARVYLDRTPVTFRNVAAANNHYDKAAESAVTADELNNVRERILAAYVTVVQSELTANEPARALKMLAYARKRRMSSEPLDMLEPQIQQRLAKR